MAGRINSLRFVLKQNLLMSCAHQNNPLKTIWGQPLKKYRFQADAGIGEFFKHVPPLDTGAFTFPNPGLKPKSAVWK
jgi:hypothetical protein